MAIANTVVVNDGEATFVIDPLNAELAINLAIAALFPAVPAAGAPQAGKITILPGEDGAGAAADYELHEVTGTPGAECGIDCRGLQNLTIELLPGARLVAVEAMDAAMILFTGNTLRICGGGTIAVDANNVAAALRTSASNNVRVENVRIQLAGDGSSLGVTPRGLHITGVPSGSALLHHTVHIRECSFEFVNQAAFDEILAIDIHNTEKVSVTGNTFCGFVNLTPIPLGVANQEGYCGTAIRLQNCPYSVVDGNLTRFINYGNEFINLDTSTLVNAKYPEGGHCVVTNNVSESGLMPFFIRSNADFVRICDNNIGRHDSSILARIKIEGKPNGTQSRDITISGNSMHVAQGTTTQYGIHVESADGVMIDGNTYYNMHIGGIFCRVEATATNVMFNPNTHLILPSPGSGSILPTGDKYTRVEWEDRYTSEIQGDVYPHPVQGHGTLGPMEGTAIE